ncbi:lantibiotic dehydratase [Streptomyces sp. NPDC006743]|uniref:lantibiotic dehydratase n=1 Tax=Streptomyces sp. NPDC006743 TaxID=3154480 RepID=UPI003454CE65
MDDTHVFAAGSSVLLRAAALPLPGSLREDLRAEPAPGDLDDLDDPAALRARLARLAADPLFTAAVRLASPSLADDLVKYAAERTAAPATGTPETADPAPERGATGPRPTGQETAAPASAGRVTADPTQAGRMTVDPTQAGRMTAGPTQAVRDTAGPAPAGRDTAGCETAGRNTTRRETNGHETAGRNTTRRETNGHETAGPETAGRKTSAPDVEASRAVTPRRLRRTLLSALKYHLRMTHRPTPFGLFAGVAAASLGAAPHRAVGAAHRTVSRPDAAWLDTVLDGLLDHPGLVARSRLVADPLHVVRDGRVVLVDHHDADGVRRRVHSVRHTRLVGSVLRYAAEPIAFPALVQRLQEAFPQATREEVGHLVGRLVAGRFLLCDLVPPPDCLTPLDHVLERLDGSGHPHAEALAGVRGALRALDAAPLTARGPRLAEVTERMRALAPSGHLVQCDLAFDARLVLPTSVGEEAERAASVLWRLTRHAPGTPALRPYHRRFLERYGTDRAVPVRELLDEARGLGLPAVYRAGADERGDPNGPAEQGGQDSQGGQRAQGEQDNRGGQRGLAGPAEPAARDFLARGPAARGAGTRQGVLAELLLTAVRSGSGEILLDDATVTALAPEPPHRLPPSLELGAEVAATGWDELCAGRFTLVLGAPTGSPRAGATSGRFVPVLDGGEPAVRHTVLHGEATTARHEPVPETPAVVAYRPRVVRSANVTAVPQWLPHRIPLGVGPAAADQVSDLRLEDLAVYADTERLRLVHTPTGTLVRPVSYSMLNPASGHVPGTARFLLDLGHEGRGWCAPWDWGPWAQAPALPRVRHGRTVLSPARWLPDRALREAARRNEGTGGRWHREVARWREQWGVPRHLRLTRADHRLTLDLDDPLHLLLLHEELRRPVPATMTEWYGGPAGCRWLQGPDGTHAAELILPLFARRPHPEPRPTAPQPRPPAPEAGSTAPEHRLSAAAPPAPPAAHHAVHHPAADRVVRPPATGRFLPPPTGRRAELPGGEWLYAKLYVPAALQRDVLARHLPALLRPDLLDEAGADRWFFLRYADPDPHLRLRVHGTPQGLWPVFLPALRDWTGSLRESGLMDRVVLDTYEPETERYGGPRALPEAERVFAADSATVLGQLSTPAAESDAARGILHILTCLGTPGEALEWLSGPEVLARRPDVPRTDKQAVASALTPTGEPQAPPAWRARSAALDRLRAVLPPHSRASVALSLAHLHCNRLLGTDRGRDLRAHATARESLRLRLDRARHGR